MSGTQLFEGEITPEQQQALDIARQMINVGIPVFAAPPCPAAHGGECGRQGHASGKEEFDLPPKWQQTVPSEVWLERWRPGWALAMVGGTLADALDNDPRNGGDAGMAELEKSGHMPRVYGVAQTPSGGQHLIIAALGERKGELLPGVDYQGGAPDGKGRGFIWIAPTVKRSKAQGTLGERLPYVWTQPPDLEWLAEGGDDSGQMIVARLQAARERKPASNDPDDRRERTFTRQQAQDFCAPAIKRLQEAKIGQIEERANDAACILSHFVPEVWPEETAYAVLSAALESTAYDPSGPSSWTAEKFHAVLAGEGGRAPADWKAVLVPDSLDEVPEPSGDEVDALIAEMLRPDQIMLRPPKKYLIRGLLHLDSESWLIGAPGSKKSFVALDMGAHVANGRDWQDMKVAQGRVVIIAAEGSGGLGNRMRAWEKEYGPIGEQMYVLPRPVQSAELSKWAVLVEACRRLKPVLVVIDTQARVTVGLEENSAKEMGIYIAAVGAIKRATGACVLSVHHTGRNGGDARGSSAIDGAQDTELKVVVPAGELRGELKVEKQKDMEISSPLKIGFRRIDLGLDEEGDPQSSLVLMTPDAWREVEVDPRAQDHGQAVQVREPEQWAFDLAPHPKSGVRRQILQTLRDAAGEAGRTESQLKKIVRDRWYDGKIGRRSGQLREDTWARHWTALLGQTVEGEPVLTNVGGQRYALSLSFADTLPPLPDLS